MKETSEAAVPEEEAAAQEAVETAPQTPAAAPKKGRRAAPEREPAPQEEADASAGDAQRFYEQETARIVRERLRAEAAASRSAGPLADSPACPLPESEAFAGAFRRQVY